MTNSQLFKKKRGGYKDIYPIAYIQGIIDASTKENLEDVLYRFNHVYIPYQESTENTRLSVPEIMRREGLWLSYKRDGRVYTEWFKNTTEDAQIEAFWKDSDNWESIVNTADLEDIFAKIPNESITPDMLSPALQELLSETHTITNLPDDEDLEQMNTVIKLKNRGYNPAGHWGKGYNIVRRNIINNKNILTASMFKENNTRYIIRYDFDLDNQEISIPENSTLVFEGGSISNGTLNGSATNINSPLSYIFNNVKFKGTWSMESLYPHYFKKSNAGWEIAFQEAIKANYSIFKPLIIPVGTYDISDTIIYEFPLPTYGNNAIIKYSGSGTCILYSASSNIDNFPILYNINIYQQSTSKLGTGIRINGDIDKCTFKGVNISGFRNDVIFS